MRPVMSVAIEVTVPCCPDKMYPEVQLDKLEELVLTCKCGQKYVLKSRPTIKWDLFTLEMPKVPTAQGSYDPDLIVATHGGAFLKTE